MKIISSRSWLFMFGGILTRKILVSPTAIIRTHDSLSFGAPVDVQKEIHYPKLRNQEEGIHSSFFQLNKIVDKIKNSNIRDGIGNFVSGQLQNIAPDSCAAEMINVGYINKDLDEDDYPFQTNCNNPSTGENSISCFPGSATVMTRNGVVPMRNLVLGKYLFHAEDRETYDLLCCNIKELTWQPGNSMGAISDSFQGTMSYEPVLFFLHRDPKPKFSMWTTIYYSSSLAHSSHSSNGILRVSPYHLIPIVDMSRCQSHEKCSFVQYVAAKRVRQGDYLKFLHRSKSAYRTANETVSFEEHISIAQVTGVVFSRAFSEENDGLYAPTTSSGNIFVDGVMTSQYSTLPHLPPSLDVVLHRFFHSVCSPLLKMAFFAHRSLSSTAYIKLISFIERGLTHLRLVGEAFLKTLQTTSFKSERGFSSYSF